MNSGGDDGKYRQLPKLIAGKANGRFAVAQQPIQSNELQTNSGSSLQLKLSSSVIYQCKTLPISYVAVNLKAGDSMVSIADYNEMMLHDCVRS